jgi:hypothetical protein
MASESRVCASSATWSASRLRPTRYTRDAFPTRSPGIVIGMNAIETTLNERLANRITGIEQELIELVAHRESLTAGDEARLVDREIVARQDELAELADRLVALTA